MAKSNKIDKSLEQYQIYRNINNACAVISGLHFLVGIVSDNPHIKEKDSKFHPNAEDTFQNFPKKYLILSYRRE